VVPLGGFSLHDVYLMHNSRPNRSPSRRAGFVMRYMPASSLFDPSRLPDGIGAPLLSLRQPGGALIPPHPPYERHVILIIGGKISAQQG
jgi:hypothetical protein